MARSILSIKACLLVMSKSDSAFSVKACSRIGCGLVKFES
jgi:hypothetical protein